MTTVRCGNKGCTHNVHGVCRADSIELTINSKEAPYALDCEAAHPKVEAAEG